MKKIIKLLPMLLLVLAFSCEQDDDSTRFYNETSTGWVEFATATSGTTVAPGSESLAIPVSLRVPVYADGISVNYTLQAVEGDFTSIVTTGSSLWFSPEQAGTGGDPRVKSIELMFQNLDTVTSPIVFDVVLTSTSVNGVNIGVDEGSIVSYRVSTPCAVITSADYNVDVIGPGGPTPSHTVALVPVAGTTNQFSVTSTWGPDFVGAATGNPAFNGMFPYSGIITINADLSVDVLSTDPDISSGGSGTYDSCNDVFLITMMQDLFTTDFTVDLTMTGL